ncbi:hypothetical protein V3G39_01925 [Dermatophilaceae bacterium Sec6.4]
MNVLPDLLGMDHSLPVAEHSMGGLRRDLLGHSDSTGHAQADERE